MFCPNCGASVESNVKFCPNCGNKLVRTDNIVETAKGPLVSIIVMCVIAVALSIFCIIFHSAADIAEIGESVYGASIILGVAPLILAVLSVRKTQKCYATDKSKSMQGIYAMSIIVLILSAIAAVVGVGTVLAANNIQMFFSLIAVCGIGAFILFKGNKK